MAVRGCAAHVLFRVKRQFAGMDQIFTREVLGRVGQHGWRPGLIGWGIGLPIVALMWVVVVRFALGVTTLQDLGALLLAIVPFVNYIRERGGNSTVGQGPIDTQPREGRVLRPDPA